MLGETGLRHRVATLLGATILIGASLFACRLMVQA